MVKRLLIVAAVLVALCVAADIGARAYAEHRLSSRLQSSLRLSRSPEVGLGGFPFLTHALAGHLPDVEVSDSGFTSHGWSFSSASIRLRDIRFSPTGLLSGSSPDLRAAGGSGSVAVSGSSLTRMVRSRVPGVSVTLSSGRAMVSVPQHPQPVPVNVRLDGQRLTISADGVPLPPVTLTIPRLLASLRYTDAGVEGSLLVIAFSVQGGTIPT